MGITTLLYNRRYWPQDAAHWAWWVFKDALPTLLLIMGLAILILSSSFISPPHVIAQITAASPSAPEQVPLENPWHMPLIALLYAVVAPEKALGIIRFVRNGKSTSKRDEKAEADRNFLADKIRDIDIVLNGGANKLVNPGLLSKFEEMYEQMGKLTKTQESIGRKIDALGPHKNTD